MWSTHPIWYDDGKTFADINEAVSATPSRSVSARSSSGAWPLAEGLPDEPRHAGFLAGRVSPAQYGPPRRGPGAKGAAYCCTGFVPTSRSSRSGGLTAFPLQIHDDGCGRMGRRRPPRRPRVRRIRWRPPSSSSIQATGTAFADSSLGDFDEEAAAALLKRAFWRPGPSRWRQSPSAISTSSTSTTLSPPSRLRQAELAAEHLSVQIPVAFGVQHGRSAVH